MVVGLRGGEKGSGRRRGRGATPWAEPHLNIVSLIDVFAVLVFFLLSGASITAAKVQTMPAQLAGVGERDEAQAQPELPILELRLDATSVVVDDGSGSHRLSRPSEVDLGEDALLKAQLRALLEELKARHPDLNRATLAVADRVKYADVVALMALLRAPTPGGGALFPAIALAGLPAQASGGGD